MKLQLITDYTLQQAKYSCMKITEERNATYLDLRHRKVIVGNDILLQVNVTKGRLEEIYILYPALPLKIDFLV